MEKFIIIILKLILQLKSILFYINSDRFLMQLSRKNQSQWNHRNRENYWSLNLDGGCQFKLKNHCWRKKSRLWLENSIIQRLMNLWRSIMTNKTFWILQNTKQLKMQWNSTRPFLKIKLINRLIYWSIHMHIWPCYLKKYKPKLFS